MDVFNRSAIKQEAKNFISQDKRWLYNFVAGIVPLLFLIIVSAIKSLNDTLFYDFIPTSYLLFSGSDILMVLIALALLPIVVSYEGKYQLNCIRYKDFSIGFVYNNAFKNYSKYFITNFIRYVFLYLWSLLFVIPGIIKNYSYYFTSFIIGDNADLDAYEAIKLSERITNEHKFELFMLDLSFFFWYLSTVFILPILFVVPYVNTTKAMYYENFKKLAIDSGIAAPEEFGMSNYYTQNNSSNVQYQNNYVPQDVNINNVNQQPIDYVKNVPVQPVDYNIPTDNQIVINNEENQDNNNNYIDKANKNLDNLNNVDNKKSQVKNDFDTNIFEQDSNKGLNKLNNKDNNNSNSDGFEV